MRTMSRSIIPMLLLAAALSLTACQYEGLGRYVDPHGLVTGCGTSDGGAADMPVADLAVPHDMTPQPDLWAPTCTYHWVREYGPIVPTVGEQEPYTLRATYSPLYSGDLPTMMVLDGIRGHQETLYALSDRTNPVYRPAPGYNIRPIYAFNPRVRMAVDISTFRMPNYSKNDPLLFESGDIDLNINWGWLETPTSSGKGSWLSPQATPWDRRYNPGHYEFDFTVPGWLAAFGWYFILNNSDAKDAMIGGTAISVITLHDVVSKQPCHGYYPGVDPK